MRHPRLDKTAILSEYAYVFDGLGLIPGECKTHLNPNAVPVVHPLRRVPVAIRDLLKKELDRIEKAEVIAKVTTPTKWVNSLVAFEKLRVSFAYVWIRKILTMPFKDLITKCVP